MKLKQNFIFIIILFLPLSLVLINCTSMLAGLSPVDANIPPSPANQDGHMKETQRVNPQSMVPVSNNISSNGSGFSINLWQQEYYRAINFIKSRNKPYFSSRDFITTADFEHIPPFFLNSAILLEMKDKKNCELPFTVIMCDKMYQTHFESCRSSFFPVDNCSLIAVIDGKHITIKPGKLIIEN